MLPALETALPWREQGCGGRAKALAGLVQLMAGLAAQELQKMQMLVVWGEIFRAESSQGRWLVNDAAPEHELPQQHKSVPAVRGPLAFPGDSQAQFGDYPRLEPSPEGIRDVAVLQEGQEHLRGVDKLKRGLVPTVFSGAARMVPGCRMGSGSPRTPGYPLCTRVIPYNGLLEIPLLVYSHL